MPQARSRRRRRFAGSVGTPRWRFATCRNRSKSARSSRQLDREFGRIDFLGNVAGEAVLARPEDIALADVEKTWRNLVFGRFCCCQEAGRRMLAAGLGSIVNIGSLASITALGRGHIAYSMAMGAVAQMTRELSTEWSGLGVRVNAILPAQVVNAGLEKRMAADPHLRDRFLSGIPRGRLGQPDDIKGLAVFLASDASAWITGALIPMDGGNLAMNGGGIGGARSRRETYSLSTAELLALYREMQIIRLCEERLAKSHQRGLIHGACHTYIGQEAVAAGVCAHLRREDAVFSTHRGHGHALAKGLDPRLLFAELYGRATGCSGGRGGSMHLFAPEIGMMGTSGIVGPCILQAAGAGYSAKLLKTENVGVAFFGDGAVNNGAFHEGLNMAGIWKLPVLFVCENNRYATEVPFDYAAGNPQRGEPRRQLRAARRRGRWERRARRPCGGRRGHPPRARWRRRDAHRMQDVSHQAPLRRHGRLHLSHARGGRGVEDALPDRAAADDVARGKDRGCG